MRRRKDPAGGKLELSIYLATADRAAEVARARASWTILEDYEKQPQELFSGSMDSLMSRHGGVARVGLAWLQRRHSVGGIESLRRVRKGRGNGHRLSCRKQLVICMRAQTGEHQRRWSRAPGSFQEFKKKDDGGLEGVCGSSSRRRAW